MICFRLWYYYFLYLSGIENFVQLLHKHPRVYDYYPKYDASRSMISPIFSDGIEE